jgi:hypothetical protein
VKITIELGAQILLLKRYGVFLVLIFFLAVGGCGGSGGGGSSISISLTWEAPTTHTDGSALNNIAGYRVYYGTAQRVYTEEVDVDIISPSLTCQPVGSVTECTYVVTGLAARTWYFVVTAYDSYGNESSYSSGESI